MKLDTIGPVAFEKSRFKCLILLQQGPPNVTCTHTGRVTNSIIYHFKASSVLSSELHDATSCILCENFYGPSKQGTLIVTCSPDDTILM